jgi:hypothetical protein
VPAGWGNANQWPAAAKSQGYAVGGTPHIGDVAVWQPGLQGASNTGHVAAVTGITPAYKGLGGGITVQEMHWGTSAGVNDPPRFVPAKVVSNLTFISPKGTSQGILGTGINLNPVDALSGSIDNFTKTVAGGAVGIGLYGGFFVLAIVLVVVGLIIMGLSTNTGRSAAKGAALAI